MAEAGSKKNPYGVDNDPMRGAKSPLQSAPVADQSGALKRKQKESVSEEFNQDDPIGDAVRSLYKKVRGT